VLCAGFFSLLLFDPEDGDDLFHRKVPYLSKSYTALYPLKIGVVMTTAVRTL
jgi:hypothetical protein